MAAVLIITFSARQTLEISGFPVLIILSATLRIALSVACAKLILLQGNAGTIINFFDWFIISGNLMPTVLTFALLATAIFWVVCKTAKGIARAGAEFTSEIVAIRQAGIDSDLNTGVINDSQALNLRSKIAREAGFFVAMGGAAKFMLCEAVIELVIIAANAVASMAVGVTSSISPEISLRMYTTLAVGSWMVMQIPLLITALAAGCLVRKSFERFVSDDELAEYRHKGAEKIKVAANELGTPRMLGPQYGKTTITIDNTAMIESSFVEDGLRLWACREIKDSSCYELTAELIESESTENGRTILMAAESVGELPVTLPVNVAMHLAQKNRKCLLIDLDLERGAVSKVFDVDSGNLTDNAHVKAIATCIDNLWVWPASNPYKDDGSVDATNIKDVIAALESRYDHIIIYAPNIKFLSGWEQLAGYIPMAMLFGEPEPESEVENCRICDFHKLLISCGCKVLEPMEVFAEAV
jgi:hypothetical protein